MSATAAARIAGDRTIVLSRVYDAPRELVFRAWTDPKHVAKWWGPDGFTTTTHAMDFRVGGMWRFIMHAPDGRDYPNRIIYEEIVAPERIVFAHDAGEGDPGRFHVTVTFIEKAGKTHLTMTSLFPTAAQREEVIGFGAIELGNQTLAHLAQYVSGMKPGKPSDLILTMPSEREFGFIRVFNAPQARIFEAWTKPEHVKRWFGCDKVTLSVCEIDLRVGGAYRFVMREPDGKETLLSGVYREIRPPGRLVYTERFNNDPDTEALVTLTLEEADGKTTMRTTSLYPSRAHRDATLEYGFENGVTEMLAKLDRLLAQFASN